MQKTVVGVFSSMEKLDQFIARAENKGINSQSISIVALKESLVSDAQMIEFAEEFVPDYEYDKDDIDSEGIKKLENFDTFLLPEIGLVSAGGPITNHLSEEDTTISDSLSDLGIPEKKSDFYEEKIVDGFVLTILQIDEFLEHTALDILRTHGAIDISSFNLEC